MEYAHLLFHANCCSKDSEPLLFDLHFEKLNISFLIYFANNDRDKILPCLVLSFPPVRAVKPALSRTDQFPLYSSHLFVANGQWKNMFPKTQYLSSFLLLPVRPTSF